MCLSRNGYGLVFELLLAQGPVPGLGREGPTMLAQAFFCWVHLALVSKRANARKTEIFLQREACRKTGQPVAQKKKFHFVSFFADS